MTCMRILHPHPNYLRTILMQNRLQAVFLFKLAADLTQLVSKFGANLARGLYHVTNIT